MSQGESRAEVVARRLGAIVRDVPSGARLGSKAEVQEMVGVAEGTLNTALRLLQVRGLIRVRSGPGGGIFAAEQSLIARAGHAVLELDSGDVDVASTIQVRNGLEFEIVYDACRFRTARDIKQIDGVVDQMRAAFEDQDESRFVHLNWDLHRTIAELTPNKTLSSLYTGLLDTIQSRTTRVVAAQGQNLHAFHARRLDIHVDLADVIRSGDADASVPVVHAHNRGIRPDPDE